MAALSPVSRVVLVVGLVAAPLYLAATSLSALLVLAVLYMPPAALFGWMYLSAKARATSKVNWDMLFRVFCGGLCPGVLLAMVVESVLTAALFFLCIDSADVFAQYERYGSAHPNATSTEILSHLHIGHTLGFFVFVFCLAFVVAGLVEEYLKYWLVKGRCCIASGFCTPLTSPHIVDPFYTVLCFAAAGCGFATFENMGYAFTQATFEPQLQTALLRGLLATPLHVLCTSLTGMRVVAAELRKAQAPLEPASTCQALVATIRCILPAVVLHGVYDFQMFVCTALLPESTYASMLMGALCLVLGAWYVYRLYTFINWDYQVLDYSDAAVHAMETGAELQPPTPGHVL
ncbi:hypothetical protein SDRG_07133 [Saprolegnia diclina VS20]|uniref:PrsW family intramembrane metalloprotease n=1 Tax=Saprolegnia diclina (strain VS20) TaxID=1156394 RepID=T0RS79_SAPDV|nr:hypothetical protein SDRG_07133 [Saprolegnia diclina VS20]EQC35423.1 hypothetical protein SDRG_07133 [Saprolegnia diclina VS20]|eukprot:XP_008611173.1 hypothetical protein SDRG_07133 [Saprolegnia diclina VS20]